MNDLETLVRSSLLNQAESERPDARQILGRVKARSVRERRRGWAAIGLSAAAVAAVLITAVVVLPDRQLADEPSRVPTDVPSSEVEPTPEPEPTPSIPTVPAGEQAVSYHGIEVLVPASWNIQAIRCGAAQEDTVAYPGAGFADFCLARESPELTVVRMWTAEPQHPFIGLATESTVVDGDDALTGTGMSPDGRHVVVLVVPRLNVLVTVESPNLARAQELLATTRITPIDSVGCPDRWPVIPSGSATGTATLLVSSEPVSVAICRYAGYWLGGSGSVADDDVRPLVEALNSLPAAAPPTSPPPWLEDTCVGSAPRRFMIDFSYPSGERARVWAEASDCHGFSATNGGTTRAMTEELAEELGNNELGVMDLDRASD